MRASILWTLIHLSLVRLTQLEVNMSIEALLKISQDMARVLIRLTAPRALIDSIRKHGVEKFHGTSLEESDKAKFWLEKLQRALDEVKCPLE